MKPLLIFFFAFSFLTGCKKSNETPPFLGYFRMTIDGIDVDCNQEIYANSAGNGNYLSIYGRSFSQELDIKVHNATPGQHIVTAYGTVRFILYDLIAPTQYYAGDDGVLGTVSGSGMINILEISNEYVKGTFEFITSANIVSNIHKTVTNGEFHIKRNS